MLPSLPGWWPPPVSRSRGPARRPRRPAGFSSAARPRSQIAGAGDGDPHAAAEIDDTPRRARQTVSRRQRAVPQDADGLRPTDKVAAPPRSRAATISPPRSARRPPSVTVAYLPTARTVPAAGGLAMQVRREDGAGRGIDLAGVPRLHDQTLVMIAMRRTSQRLGLVGVTNRKVAPSLRWIRRKLELHLTAAA